MIPKQFFRQGGRLILPGLCLALQASAYGASDPGGCKVTYSIREQWSDGFVADISLENRTNTAIDGWQVLWQWPSGQKITGYWSSHLASDGQTVTASNLDWNARIPPGDKAVFGLQASFSAGNVAPSSFQIEADGCHTSHENPPQPPPVPQPSPTPPPEPQPTVTPEPPVPPPPPSVPGEEDNGDDWLRVEDGNIVDQSGNVVWLTGLNWFGFNTGTNAFDGLWAANLEESLKAIAGRGFNLLRLPISTELVDNWRRGVYPAPRSINGSVNQDLVDKNSLEIFDRVVTLCRKYGLKIMIDIHSPMSESMGHMDPLWYKGEMKPENFYAAWQWLARRYKNDDTIVAFDLKNEPHGKPHQDAEPALWDGSELTNNWKHAAEKAAAAILEAHPNVLIMVEGVEATPATDKGYGSKNERDYYFNWWGGNLREVRNFPIDLGPYQQQLVYSPHDYGPAVYQQPWFYPGFNKTTLYRDVWYPNWAYIQEEKIAPLLIGEWGGFLDGKDNEKWLIALRDFIGERHIHHTFWCFNANSGDTGGLVQHDFKTWDEAKYKLVLPVLWQGADGRFVGLDHKIPLGSAATGLTVTDHYAAGGKAPEYAP
jgi:aryl-phospho-beta-D-glucosidase BglC (GH1 family)